jgi:hypothetical protein
VRIVRSRFFVISFVIAIAILFPTTALFAGNVSYPQNSFLYFSGNGVTLTIMGGSSANTVDVSASTVSISLAAGDSLELLDPSSRHLQNTAGLAECTTDAQGNHLVMGPYQGTTTIIVTPTLTDCAGASGGGGGGGGGGGSGSGNNGPQNGNSNSSNANVNQSNQNANSNGNANSNVNLNSNANTNANVNVNANVNSPVNVNGNSPQNTNSAPNTNSGVGNGNSNTSSANTSSLANGSNLLGNGLGGGQSANVPVVVTPGNGTIIAVTQPTISGTAAPNTTVDVSLDGQPSGSALSDSAGMWSVPVSYPLPSGGHVVVAVANGAQSVPVQFVIDVVPPPAPAIISAALLSTQLVAGKIYDSAFFVSGTATEQEDVLFSFDGGTAFKGLSSAPGTWQTTLYATLAEGEHTLAVQAVDLLGNVSAATVLPFRVPLVGAVAQALEPLVTGTPAVVSSIPACADGIDNDGDGWIDFPADAGCRSRDGEDEASDTRSVLTPIKAVLPALAPIVAPIAAAIEHPVVQQVNQTIAAPTALVIVSANAAVALPELGFLTYLRFLFLQPLLLFRRRRRGWGTVYNSMTKLPVDLAIVRLYDEGTKRLIRTTVTDRNGRFLFFVPPGTYRLEVTKPQFVFPSTYLAGKTEDVQYPNVYHGVPFTVGQAAMVAPNIPIDPHIREKPDREVLRDASKQKIHTAFSGLGIVLAAVVWFISPTIVNTVALAVHVSLFFLFRRLARGFTPKTWGIVSDFLHRAPLSASVVRIFEPTYNRLLETQVTDQSGRYAFLVGRNRYYFTVAKQGYKPAKSPVLDLTTGPDRAVVAENVAMEPVEQSPAATSLVQPVPPPQTVPREGTAPTPKSSADTTSHAHP